MLSDFINKLVKNKNITIAASVGLVIAIVLVVWVFSSIGSKKDSDKNNNTQTATDVFQNSDSLVKGGEEKLSELLPPANDENKSPLTGLTCENYNRRPFAVMMAGDTIARPLSGLSQADMVFEMPVITGGITRLMGVFNCGEPTEIGSLRSARHDYITLALSVDAIFAHWGGSHFALDDLKAGVADDIDALRHSGPFFRKSHIPKPHNGFTSFTKLLEKAKQLNYRSENKFSGYPHLKEDVSSSSKNGILEVGFSGSYKVKYEYDAVANSYKRFWNGAEDKDYSTGKNIIAKNIVVMKAASRQIEGQYNDVDIEGEGELKVYRNGEEISGKWNKSKSKRDSKLYFLDFKGEEIEFAPGQIWVEIIEPYQEVKWSK